MTADDPRPAGEACEAFTECVVGNVSHHTHMDTAGRSWCCCPYPYTARPAASGGATDGEREAADELTALTEEMGLHAPVVSQADDPLQGALRIHHPIMRSETGPFSGCRCGQVKLGQDVIAHVVAELHAALAPEEGR